MTTFKKPINPFAEQAEQLTTLVSIKNQEIEYLKEEANKYWDMFNVADANLNSREWGTSSDWNQQTQRGNHSASYIGKMTKFALQHAVEKKIPTVTHNNGRIKAPFTYWDAIEKQAQEATSKGVLLLEVKHG